MANAGRSTAQGSDLSSIWDSLGLPHPNGAEGCATDFKDKAQAERAPVQSERRRPHLRQQASGRFTSPQLLQFLCTPVILLTFISSPTPPSTPLAPFALVDIRKRPAVS
ncbi:Snurportin1 domain-containing protein [Rhizoctonia solani AG-1 IA]|uniref:Snurportin1 domain-containing protein n=1 Tax=Thanatephorus cucumeris (strain AG1-IA) TaxID=983506 RepID=L8X490_THACA|nr:Snurportin1 domain-containing protein [Rhizoctonia solani AG-1 IA]